uniref:Tudor domain-containing protein n=1 Tax=Rhodnius prolixus TaxID=13249 RepID=T1I4A6_RHOPR
MSQSENCSAEVSVIKQESKVNGKIDTIEGQLSFMGEGTGSIEEQPAATSAAKDESSFSLPTLSLFPKRFDDSQDTQDDLRNASDLPNGHNNPDAVDIAPRTKSLDELLQESEDLPDTELIGCTKEFVESKMENQNFGNIGETDKNAGQSIEKKDNSEENRIVEKNENISTSKNNLEDETNEEIKNDSDQMEEEKETAVVEKLETNPGPIEDTTDDIKKDDSFKLEISESQLMSTSDVEESKGITESKAEVKERQIKVKIDEDNKELVDDRNPAVDSKRKETSDDTDDSTKAGLVEKEQEKNEVSEECHCTPECQMKMKLLKKCLNNACSQLDGYIKLKKKEDLSNFLKLLTEIELIAENKKNDEEQGKKRKSRASKITKTVVNTPKKEVPDKKSRIREAKTEEPMSEINFKNLKGLAVFAKWPNSGWYYPGIIEGLTNSDWKEATNVTVKFYDGLVREMKNINILPAHLIPATSIVCDLDDETEMVVLNTNRIENNCVEFTLSTKEGTGKNLDVNFNKLAIKALHMKSIKQQLEPNMDVMLKKMHMVSLDNLVSGRRSRVRTHKDDDDENAENTTPRKYSRKSVAADPDKSAIVDESTNPTTPMKTTPFKRGVAAAERSTPKRTATPSKRMKQ